MTPRQMGMAAGAGSALLLAAALGFQAAGYAPCELCILQRWPHLAAAVAGALVAVLGWRRWLAASALAVARPASRSPEKVATAMRRRFMVRSLQTGERGSTAANTASSLRRVGRQS